MQVMKLIILANHNKIEEILIGLSGFSYFLLITSSPPTFIACY